MTGVQTCALPIFIAGDPVESALHCGANSQHPDGMQPDGRYFRIYNNHFTNWPNAFLSADPSDSIEGYQQIFNNIFEITQTPSPGHWDAAGRVIDYNVATGITHTNLLFANNTIVSTNIFTLRPSGSSVKFRNWIVKNNLWYNASTNNALTYLAEIGDYT